MPCCGGHASGRRLPLAAQPPRGPVEDIAGDALLNLSVLKTLSEHVDSATAVSCYSVCRAWREAFGLSCRNSTLCTSEVVDGTRGRFAANLHGSVTLEVNQPSRTSQRGFDRHLAALARNRHMLQLKIHLPVREAPEPQLTLGGLSVLQPLTQLTSLVVARNPTFTSAPHVLTEEDLRALGVLRSLTFLELCTAAPPSLGLGAMASMATASMTQLRTLAFGHTSALWRIPQVGALCRLLDVCPCLTDLRLRCCAPPRNAKQLPQLMALPLPQRLTNFALTFARRLARGEGGGAGGPAAALMAAAAAAVAGAGAAAGSDDDEDTQYGEYEDMDEPWDSVDHLAPKPGLHVLIVEKGVRVTRMDVNVTISVAASELPTVSIKKAPRGKKTGRTAGSGGRTTAGRRRLPSAPVVVDDVSAGEMLKDGGADDEEDVPPYDVTPMVLAEYDRLVQQELGLTGTLAEPEDLHLGVRLDILEDEEEAVAAAAAAAVQNVHHLLPPGAQMHVLHAAAAALQMMGAPGANAGGGGGGGPAGVGQALLAAMVGQAGGGGGGGGMGGGLGGGGPGGHLPPPLVMLLNQMAQMNIFGGAGGGNNNNNNNGQNNAAAAGTNTAAQPPAGGGGRGGGSSSSSVSARAVQLQLGPLSPHMCYLNLALVPMVTHLAMVAPGLGPNGEEVLQPPQPPADTRVAPVLLDVRGGGYTQLKSLAITGYVDQDCRPATWMSRGWLSHIPTGMPSLEYLALYDTLPAAANDRRALEGVRSLSHLEHLELRPLYLRFPGQVKCPLVLPPPALPPKLLQLTLKKVSIPAPPPAAAGGLTRAGPSSSTAAAAAAALLPDLPLLTHLWLFDCDAPDLTIFRTATRLEDLRLGGTTTTTPLPQLLAAFPGLRSVILDVSHSTAPGWWSARQMSALSGLRCLRSLQLDAAPMERPSAAVSTTGAASSTAAAGGAAGSAAQQPAQAPYSKASTKATNLAAAVLRQDSDDDSDAYVSTEEDIGPAPAEGSSAAGAGPASAVASGTSSGEAAGEGQTDATHLASGQPSGSGALAAAQGTAAAAATDVLGNTDGGGNADISIQSGVDGNSIPATLTTIAAAAGTPAMTTPGVALGATLDDTGDLASVLAVLAGLTQLTDLTLSFDTPTLFYDQDETEADERRQGQGANHGAAAAGGGGAVGWGAEDSDSEEGDDDDDDDVDSSITDSSVEDCLEAGYKKVGRSESGGGNRGAGKGTLSASRGGAGGRHGQKRRNQQNDGLVGGGGGGENSDYNRFLTDTLDLTYHDRVCDALLGGQSLVALAALQGLWRLRIGLPHGSVWEEVTERLLPGLRLAMPRTSVEMDVL